MAFERVAALADLPPGALLPAVVGRTPLAVCNVDGALHAFQGECPHRNGPLGQGNVADGNLICPWHAWEFRCATGEYDYNPAIVLKRYRVEVRDDGVYVEAP